MTERRVIRFFSRSEVDPAESIFSTQRSTVAVCCDVSGSFWYCYERAVACWSDLRELLLITQHVMMKRVIVIENFNMMQYDREIF